VGLSKLQKSVADLSVKTVFYAATIEEAKEWLAREEKKRHKS